MGRQGKRLTPKKKARLQKLHEKGLSIDAIAIDLQIEPKTVRRHIDPDFRVYLNKLARVASRRRRGIDGDGTQRIIREKKIHPLMEMIVEEAEYLGLTNAAIAKAAGRTSHAMNEYLYRGTLPSLERYIKMAEAVGLEVVLQRRKQ